MKEITIKVDPDGNVLLLYDDAMRLESLGKKQVVRASNVVFVEDRQRWIIVKPDGTQIGEEDGYFNRLQAIADEIRILSEELSDGHIKIEELGFQ